MKMKTKISMRAATLPLLLGLALVGAGSCGEMPTQDESGEEGLTTSAVEASESPGPAYGPDEVGLAKAAPSCVGMRSGSIKRTSLPGQWTGIIDNACDRSVRINLDIAYNKDPGCRTYAAKTSHNTKWWAGLATSGFRGVYECD